jgi:hypothetical protein
MKMTFEVPDQVGEEFRRAIPPGERSRLIAKFMQQEAKRRQTQVEQACQRANRIAQLNTEMKDWERFDDIKV